MKQLKMTIVLAMLVFATFLPGVSMGASAQGVDLCTEALEHGEGAYAGYTVVYGSGGSGSQIVLGSLDGNDYLSGGSGNDVLCAWGSGNTLEGGSGNDILVAIGGEGNMLLGGSGNDTLMGNVNNTFDGGSGQNGTVTWDPVIWIDGKYVMGEGFPSGSIVVQVQIGPSSWYSSSIVDGDGRFTSGEWGFCENEQTTGDVTVTIWKADGVIARETTTLECS